MDFVRSGVEPSLVEKIAHRYTNMLKWSQKSIPGTVPKLFPSRTNSSSRLSRRKKDNLCLLLSAVRRSESGAQSPQKSLSSLSSSRLRFQSFFFALTGSRVEYFGDDQDVNFEALSSSAEQDGRWKIIAENAGVRKDLKRLSSPASESSLRRKGKISWRDGPEEEV